MTPLFIASASLGAALLVAQTGETSPPPPGAGGMLSRGPAPGFRGPPAKLPTAPQGRLAQAVEQALPAEAAADALDALVGELYARRAYRPVWVRRDGPTPSARALLRQLEDAPAHALPASRYGVRDLERAVSRAPIGRHALARLDVRLSRAALSFGRDLLHGVARPEAGSDRWRRGGDDLDLVRALEEAMASQDVAAFFTHVRPQSPEYRDLQAIMQNYHALAAEGDWPALPDGLRLEPGASADPADIERLAARLAKEGYLDPSVTASGQRHASGPFEGPVLDALRRFQAGHGLAAEGVLGPRTRAELSVTAEQRVRQIAANLERWRWMPRDLGARHVFVNIPAFEAETVRPGAPRTRMKAVVGETDWATPAMSTVAERVVINPYWYVPEEILEKDLWKKIRSRPGFLDAMGFEVVHRGRVLDTDRVDFARYTPKTFPYLLRQKAGPENAMGLTKVDLVDSDGIYLHDTSAPAVFEARRRDRSHGCIRVSEPEHLAGFVLAESGPPARGYVEQAIAAGDRVEIEVEHEVPVHLPYLTVRPGPDGPRFHPDLYGRDAKLQAALPEAEDTR